MQMTNETHAIERRVIWGQICWFGAHGGRPLRGGRERVVLKIVKTVESMARTMSEQLKLTPLRKNLATRTRFLTFYETISDHLRPRGAHILPGRLHFACRSSPLPSRERLPP